MPRAVACGAPGWSFEDAEPGLTILHSGGRTIGADEHVWLAMISMNASDVHLDGEYAKGTAFGRPLVLGALTAAIVVGLSEPLAWPPDEASRGLARGWGSIRLTLAVGAGDTLRSASTVLSAEPDADGRGGRVRRRIVGLNQHGDEVAVIEDERDVPRRIALDKGLLTTVPSTG